MKIKTFYLLSTNDYFEDKQDGTEFVFVRECICFVLSVPNSAVNAIVIIFVILFSGLGYCLEFRVVCRD